jgi:glycosyltransferase involved in cell wall biosynthesis
MNTPANNLVFSKRDFPFVTVVINYHNEAENVDMAPSCLSRQSFTNFEVILVDDCSTDETTDKILKKYGDLLTFHVVRLPKTLGLRPARSIGVKSARGRIIVTLDLHTEFDASFLEKVVAAFEENPRVGACGCLVLRTGEKWFNRGFRTFEKLAFTVRNSSASYKYVFGSAAAFKAEAFQLIGTLSEDEVVEDTDFSWRLKQNGWDVLLLKNNIVYHKDTENFSKWARLLFVGGLRAAPTLTKYKLKLFYPQNLFRFFVFPLLFILLLIFQPVLDLVLVTSSLIILTSIFALKHNSLKDAFYGSAVTALFVSLSTFGFYYGLILVALKKMKLIKRFNVDINPQKLDTNESRMMAPLSETSNFEQKENEGCVFRMLFLSLEPQHRQLFLKVERELRNIANHALKLDFTILNVKPWDVELAFLEKIFDRQRTKIVEELINKHKPDILIVANDMGINATFIKVCKLLRIPTIAIQDGVLSEKKERNVLGIFQSHSYLPWRILSLLSNNPFVARLLVFSGWRIRALNWGIGGADKIAAMGDFYKRVLVSRGISSSRIIVTGYPLLDDVSEKLSGFDRNLVFKKLGMKSTQKLAVLVTQPFVEDGVWDLMTRETLVKTVIETSKRLQNVHFVIKLHPREDLCPYEKIVGNQMPLLKNIDLHELLLASDAVLTVSSTVGLWALAYKKPLIILNFLSSENNDLYSDVAFMVNDPREFSTIMKNAINNPSERNAEAFILDHISKLDGQASRRVAEQIFAMIRQTKGSNLVADELTRKAVIPFNLHETNNQFKKC